MVSEEVGVFLNLPIDVAELFFESEFLQELPNLLFALFEVVNSNRIQLVVLEDFILVDSEEEVGSRECEEIHVQLTVSLSESFLE